jgi:hypothetical protein
VGLPRTAHNPARVSPQHSPMSIDIEKQRARWRRAQRKYQQTAKALAARRRYRDTDAHFITQSLYNRTPMRKLAHRLSSQERRSAQI